MQSEFFYETVHDAWKAGVEWCGGPKKLGSLLWGQSMSPDDAGRKLRACLNPERNEKLSENERLVLLRHFRESGFHGVMNFICEAALYEPPRTVEPEDQEAEQIRALDAVMDRAEAITKRIERIQAARAAAQIRSVR